MSKYQKPALTLIRLSLNERIACSGSHLTEKIQPDGIVLSETDGEPTRDRLNEPLAAGDVRLAPGEYPVAPGVVIDGRTLDLGGARLISTVQRFNGALIVMAGDHPRLRNGRLSGLYAAAPGEEGYVKYEAESAVRLPAGGFTGAVIEGVEMDRFCGYAVCTGGEGQVRDTYAVRHFSPAEAPGDGVCRFGLVTGMPFVTARHAVGYNYYISRSPVVYVFRDAGGRAVGRAEGVPGEPVARPSDAVSVDVTVDMPSYVRYGLFEYAYDATFRIEGCVFRCNQRLGIANLCGVSEVIGCRPISTGYPREDHTGISWDSSTSGFVDIEDIQTPRLTVYRCSSGGENLGIASRAYELTVEDSPKLTTRIYGGWTASVTDSGPVVYDNAKAALQVTVGTNGTLDDKAILDTSDKSDEDMGVRPVVPDGGAVFRRCRYGDKTIHLWYGKKPQGVFEDCDFDLRADWLLSHGKPDYVFRRCRIRLNGHHLIDQKVFDSGVFTFEDCEIDRPEGIAAGCAVKIVIR